jgi:hypothetical protein
MEKKDIVKLRGRSAIIIKRDGYSPRGIIAEVSDDSITLTNGNVERIILFSEIVEIRTLKEDKNSLFKSLGDSKND